MGGARIAPTEESSNESIQHEGDVLGFLWLARCNPLRIHSRWSDSKQGVLRSSSEAFQGSRTPEEVSVVDEPELGVAPRQCTSSLVVPCAQFLAKNETTVVPQPSYSPDLAPADFFLFPKLKSTLKGRRVDTIDEIQKNSTNKLFAIPKEAFQKAFQSWQKRWERCVVREGNYFEGDKLE